MLKVINYSLTQFILHPYPRLGSQRC